MKAPTALVVVVVVCDGRVVDSVANPWRIASGFGFAFVKL
jgi:hypothetical protein